jgi:transposase
VVDTGRRRRRWTEEEKLKILVESFQGPRQIAATARRYGLSRSLLLRWRRSFHPEPKNAIGTQLGFVAAKLVADTGATPDPIRPASNGAIEIEFAAGVRMRITGGEGCCRGLGGWTNAMIAIPSGVRFESRPVSRRHAPRHAKPGSYGPGEPEARSSCRRSLRLPRSTRGDLVKILWHEGSGTADAKRPLNSSSSCRGDTTWPRRSITS